ncbi:MAG: putative Ig domain-containing protein, partial [Magnetococcales bacterium]|nr:putative Ig domain-containing protein [Magnetococcales bacterium]
MTVSIAHDHSVRPLVMDEFFSTGGVRFPLDGEVMLERASLFLEGEFVREGDNLVIIGLSWERVVIAGYFTTEPRPVLTAPNGAFLLQETVEALLLPAETTGVMVAGPATIPGSSPAIGAVAGTPGTAGIGKVRGISGTATARGQGGASRTLKSGDELFEGEELKTEDGGQLQLLFLDGTQFQLGAGARVVLNKYLYNASAGQGEFAATVMKGAFAYTSGHMAQLHAGRHTMIKTPTAQIGVRGSALQGEVSEDGRTVVVHTSGILDISDAYGQGTVTLLQPGMATVVTLDGSPQPAFPVPQSILDRFNNLLPPLTPEHKPQPTSDSSSSVGQASLNQVTLLDTYRELADMKAVLLKEDGNGLDGRIKGIDFSKISGSELQELKHDWRELVAQLPPVTLQKEISHGVFLDSAVEGIQYHTATLRGVTDQNGGFIFREGETVSFAIGGIQLGSTNPRATDSGLTFVTPGTLAQAAVAGDVDKQKMVTSNILRLLQTLDTDNNPSNGITIAQSVLEAAADSAAAKAIDITSSGFGSDTTGADAVLSFVREVKGNNTVLVTEEQAWNHYNQTLVVLDAMSNVQVRIADSLFAAQGSPFQFSLQGVFSAPTGSVLDYHFEVLEWNSWMATKGVSPQDWLTVNNGSLLLSGTPGNAAVGTGVIKVTATLHGSESSIGFMNYALVVQNSNDKPVAVDIPTQSVLKDATFQLTSSAFSDVDLNLKAAGHTLEKLTYSATVDGQPLPDWLQLTASDDSSSFTLSGSALAGHTGPHAVTMMATDLTGQSVTRSFTLIVDTPPEHGPDHPLTNQSVRKDHELIFAIPEGVFRDADSSWDHLSYAAVVQFAASSQEIPVPTGGFWLTFDPTTATFTARPGADAVSGLIQVTATDSAGYSVQSDFVLTVDHTNYAPVVAANQVADQFAVLGTPINLSVASWFTDPDNDRLTFSATALPDWLGIESDTGNFFIKPDRQAVAGQFAGIMVTAADPSRSVASTSFTLFTGSPPTANLDDQTVEQGQPLTIHIAKSEFDSWDLANLTYSVSGLPSWLRSVTPGTDEAMQFFGTPGNNDVGMTDIHVVATDRAGGNVDATFTLTVVDVNDAPLLPQSVSSQQMVQGKPFYLEVAVSDPDHDLLTYTAGLRAADNLDLPAWLNLNRTLAGFTLSGIAPADAPPSLQVDVTARDGRGGSVLIPLHLDINAADRPPVLVNALSGKTATQESPFFFQLAADAFRAVDASHALVYTATLLDGTSLSAAENPSFWLHYDAASRTFSGIPHNADVGTLTVKVTATDPVIAKSSSDTFTLQVANINDAPIQIHQLTGQVVAASGTTTANVLTVNAAGVFQDVDAGDTLVYTATLLDGSPLPNWIALSSPVDPTLHIQPTLNEVGLLAVVKLVATDQHGLNASDSFSILVASPNTAPAVGTPIADRNATEDKLFFYELPEESFTDADLPDDRLSFTAQALTDDGAGHLLWGSLPGWLKFDSDTRSFVGIPGNDDAGILQLRVMATDWAKTTSPVSPFAITVANSNDAPTVAQAIANQSAFIGSPDRFSFTIPTDAFSDVDRGDTLTLSVVEVGKSALPDWIHFNTGTLHVNPADLTVAHQGIYHLKVTATDSGLAKVSSTFTLSVRSPNTSPILDGSKTPANQQVAQQDQLFVLSLDSGLFQDSDVGDTLTWSATRNNANRSVLPAWLRFDPLTHTFVGTPANADAGTLDVRVAAQDRDGASVASTFHLQVKNVNDAPVLAVGKGIPDQKVNQGEQFALTLDEATFADPDMAIDPNASLSWVATVLDGTNNGMGSPLTAVSDFWLHFNPDTRTFSGTPGATDARAVTIKVTATDNAHALDNSVASLSAFDLFNLIVNRAPTATEITTPARAQQNQLFYFKLPTGTFQDADLPYGDTLTLSTAGLPSWLTFNAASQSFIGTPGDGDVTAARGLNITVTATDSANASVARSFALAVDNVNDAPELVERIGERHVDTGTALQFSLANHFQDVDTNLGDQLAYSVTFLGGDAPVDWLIDKTSGLFSLAAANTVHDYAIKVTATDLAGEKVSDLFMLHVVPPNHAPVVVANGITNQQATQDQIFSWRIPKEAFVDPDGDLLQVSADNKPNWLYFDVDTGTFIGTPGNSDAGNHTITVTASDPRGQSVSSSFTLVVANVNDAPVLTGQAIEVLTATQGSIFQSVLPNDRFTDIDGDALTFKVYLSGTDTELNNSSLADWLHFDAATRRLFSVSSASDTSLAKVPDTLPVGTVNLRVTASDADGLSVSDTCTIMVQAPNRAPTVGVRLGDLRIEEDSFFSYRVPDSTFFDADGDVLIYTATLSDGGMLPGWLQFDQSTGILFGTPVNQIVDGMVQNDTGTIQIKITAQDGRGGEAANLFNLAVDNINDAPVLVKPVHGQELNLTAIRGSFFQLQLASDTFQDPDRGDNLLLSAATPAWLTFDPETRTFSGIANEQSATGNIKITVQDAHDATGYDLFTLTVLNPNQIPVVTHPVTAQLSQSDGVLRVNQGDTLRFQFSQDTFHDADGDPLTYRMAWADGSAVPDDFWLQLDGSSRTLSGQVDNAHVGTWGIKLIATDSRGDSASTLFNVVVNNVNDAPTIGTGLYNQQIVQGNAFRYQLAADAFVDADVGDRLTLLTPTTISGDPLPDWLHFDAATATFSGTPGIDDVGSLSVKVTAEDNLHARISDSFQLQVAANQTGVFLDSKVVGIGYTVLHFDPLMNSYMPIVGLTNQDGAFPFFGADDIVSFNIGGIVLGQTRVGNVITPATLAGSENVKTISNMLRLLQTLDNDGNPDNGITITQAARDAAVGKSLNFSQSEESFASNTTLTSYLTAVGKSGGLVSTESAWKHFLGTLATTGSGGMGLLTTSGSAPIPVALEDRPFSYQPPVTLPSGAKEFKLSSSSSYAIPLWIAFDKETGLISGTPTNNDVGTLSLTITASGSSAIKKAVNITVLNTNDAPTLNTAFFGESRQATVGNTFYCLLSPKAFTDRDKGDRLTFSATLANGAALSSTGWLSFDADSKTFYGKPTLLAQQGTLTVKVTAEDGEHAAVSGLFDIKVGSVNHAPQLSSAPIVSQNAYEDRPFSFRVPSGRFTDEDLAAGDRLIYTAEVTGSSASTSSWLKFDAETMTFSGTPVQSDVGTVSVKITATDQAGAKASDSFILVVNNTPDAPLLVSRVTNQQVFQEAPFRFSLPSGLFADSDPGDRLTLAATLADGGNLPAWLKFDPQTGTFSGLSATSGVLHLQVTASDQPVTGGTPASRTASAYFDLTVQAVNHAPTLNALVSLGSPAVKEGESLTWQLPSGHFFDQDNDILTFTSRLLTDKSLPSWLVFDAATNTFTASPGNAAVGTWGVKVIAQDSAGLSVADSFKLTVLPVNHAPILQTVLSDQTATTGKLFTFQVAPSVFADDDASDRLYLSANAQTRSGDTTTSWLNFDPETRTFSGLPNAAGTIDVTVTARDRLQSTDPDSQTVSDTFAITVADPNRAPVRSDVLLINSSATEATPFSFVLPSGLFSDPNGDPLSINIQTIDGKPLPSNGWLRFANGVLSGTPGAGDVGTLSVKVVATDSGMLATSDTFTIAVHALNRAPELKLQTPDQQINEGVPFFLKLDPGTFQDPNPSDRLTLSAMLATPVNGSTALGQIGLAFDPLSRTFSGTPTAIGAFRIAVTATDDNSSGDAAGSKAQQESFALTVAHVNHAPVLAHAVVVPVAKEDQGFTFSIPSTTFSDPDIGDHLNLSVSSAAGTTLPGWLQVSGATLSGTPGNEDVGTVEIKVQATDDFGAKSFTTFSLQVTNSNDAPTQGKILPDLPLLTTGQRVLYTLPVDTFADVDSRYGDRLTLAAKLSGGADLTASDTGFWLHFDPATRSLSGTPTVSGTWEIRVTATDLANAQVAANPFKITVVAPNLSPVLVHSLAELAEPSRTAIQDQSFLLQFASTAFADPNPGDQLRYEATLLTGGSLPSWLNFNSANRTFSGTPGQASIGGLDIKLTAIDQSGAKGYDSFHLTVANINDVPTGVVTVSGTARQYSVLTADHNLVDRDGLGAIDYRWESSSDNGAHWTLLGRGATFTPAQTEVGRLLHVVAGYTDGYGSTESVASAALLVANVNDRPSGAVKVSGSMLMGGVLTADSNTLADQDGMGAVSYRWQSSLDGTAGWTNIANASGSSFTLTPGQAGQYLRVLASYRDGQGTDENVASEVIRLNAAPTITSGVTGSVTENAALATVVYTVRATDPDLGDAVFFSLSGTDASHFSINSTTGSVTLKSQADFESKASYSITVVATDSSLATSSQAVTINVINANDAPVITSGSNGTVVENGSPATIVYTAAATDQDNGDNRIYTLTGPDAALFSINSVTGAVTLNSPADYESRVNYHIGVVATDGGGLAATQPVTISVGNVNEVPVIVSGTNGTIAENAPLATPVYTIVASDVDAGESRNYSLSGSDAGLFTVNAVTGVVTLKASADFESRSSYNINVAVTDSGGLTTSKAMVVNITNVNEAPYFTSGSMGSVAENASIATVVYTGLALDSDAGDFRTYALSGSDAAAFSIDAVTGEVRLKEAADYETRSSYTIQVAAIDHGGLSTSQSVVIQVANVNDPPTLSQFADVPVTAREESQAVIGFSALLAQGNEADVDGSVTGFVIKTVSTGNLLIGETVATATPWMAGANDRVDGTHYAYWNPVANANGMLDAFTVLAMDDTGAESSTPVQVRVRVDPVPDVLINGIDILADSGSSANDFVTSMSTQNITATLSMGLQAGEVLYGSTDGGTSWSNVNSRLTGTALFWENITLSGSGSIQFKVTDTTSGYDGVVAAQNYIVDSTAPAIAISGIDLSLDSGTSDSDFITRIAAQTITATLSAGLANGDLLYGSVDGGTTWSDITGKVNGSALIWDGAMLSGSGTIQLKVADLAGNQGALASQGYLLDGEAPATTISAIDISVDSGSNDDDFETNTTNQTITATLSAALASGERLYGSVNDGQDWLDITSKAVGTAILWDGAVLTGGVVFHAPTAIKIKVSDAAGNDGMVATQSYILDMATPSVTVGNIHILSDGGSSSTDFVTNVSTQTITATLSGLIVTDHALFGSTDNGATWHDITGKVSGTSVYWDGAILASGTHAIHFKVSDVDAGNDGAVATQTYTLDTTSPGISIGALALASDTGFGNSDWVTRVAAQTITGTLSASLAAGDLLYGSVDGGVTWTEITDKLSGSMNLAWDSATLLAGNHAIRLKVVDLAGNSGPVASGFYSLDSTAPQQTITGIDISLDSGLEEDDFETNTANQTITATLSHVLSEGERLYGSVNDGQDWTDITSKAIGTAIIWDGAVLTGGVVFHAPSAIKLKVSDTAGNEGMVATQSYILDTAIPGVTISNIHLSNDSGSSNTDFDTNMAVQTITATLSGPIVTDHALFGSTDGGLTWSDITGKVTGTDISWDGAVLVAGSNTIQIKVTDVDAGNDGAIASQAYYLDTINPGAAEHTISAISLSSDTGISSSDFKTSVAAQTITASISAALTPGEDHLLGSLDGGQSWTDLTDKVNGTQITWDGALLSGSSSIKFKIATTGGNDGPVATQAYLLDQTAPNIAIGTIQISADTGISSSDFATKNTLQTISAVLSFHLSYGDMLFGSVDDGTTWTDITNKVVGTVVSWDGATLANGNHTIRLKVSDQAGNEGQIASQSYLLDDTAPGVTVTGIDLATDSGNSDSDFLTSAANQSITATLSAGLAAGEILYGSVNGGLSYTDLTSQVNGTAIAWTGVTLAGNSVMQFKVSDAVGNDGTVAFQPYRLDNSAPTTTISGIALSNDSGVSQADFKTNMASQTVTATLSGALQADERLYGSLNGGGSWSDISDKLS